MKRTTSTIITLVALTALAACATPVSGKVVSAKKYLETHSREEFREMIQAKRGRPTSSSESSRRGASRRLTIGNYCERDSHCSDGEFCDTFDSWSYNGQTYSWGYCAKGCSAHTDCGDGGTYCSIQEGYMCRSCAAYANFDSIDGTSPCRQCSAHTDCDKGKYCARSWYYDNDGDYYWGNYIEKYICTACSECWSWNTFDYGTCPDDQSTTDQCYVAPPADAYQNSDWKNATAQESLRELPADCWVDAAHAEYDELFVGDCGAFGEETELWCEGFCIADSWLDCCDPKAGAIAALTMGCFFAFVGALFSAAWIFKCWCFKKPNALMLQAMANQQQQRAMAAGHMQSPVVVQMQAPVAK